ncbi:MAG: ComEC/Rec2 family competence protein [Clostridiales bacterium]|nr:ComEC/Rec2 family competence protein [Clostridiales bacterium]
MKKLINFRPILFIMLSLCCGISATYFFTQEKIVWGVFFVCVFVLPLMAFLVFFTKRNKLLRNAIFSSVFLIFFILGGLRTYASINNYNNANLSGHNYDIKAKIVQIYESETGHKFILDNAYINGNRKGEIYYKISLSVIGKSDFDIGDIISFNANLYDNQSIYEDRFNSNDVERGIKYYTSVNASEINKISTELNIYERLNLFIRDSLKSGLDEKEFSVGYALLLGNSNFMDNDLISSYRYAGVAHIFAVSGLHIGFLATLLIFIFKKLKINPFLKTIIITFILLFYSGICGFSASSLRATVMTSVMLFASLKGSRYDSLTALSFAGILILLFSPVQLFCVGFELSFMVVTGIIVLAKPIAKLIKFLPQKIAMTIGTVLSAQIFSLPICLYAFGYVSTISVLINLLFIPIVSFIFTLTLFATIIGGIFGISNILLFPSNYIFKLINILIGAFDYKIFIVGGIVIGSGIISYYFIWLILADMFNLKRLAKLIVSLCLSVTFITTIIISNTSNNSGIKMYVTSNDTLSATYISLEEQNVLIVSDVEYIYSTSRLKKLVQKTGEDRVDTLIVMGGYMVNLQQFITKMTSVYSIKKVYYYGHKQYDMEEICNISFPKIILKNFADGEIIKSANIDLSFSMQGKVILGRIGSQKSAIFSRLPNENLDFSYLDNSYDIMVCLDRAEALLSRYKPTIAISYKYSNIYQNAISYGNICLKID